VDGTAAPAKLFTGAFFLAWVANFLHAMALHTYVHLGGFLEGLELSELWIGIVIGTLSLVAIASRPAIGWTMDERGRRAVILLGGVANVLACLAYLRIEDFGPWLFAVRVLHGIGQAAVFSGMFTYAADIVPASRRAQGIALFGISGMLPLALGGLIGDFVIVDDDYRVMFQLTAAFAFGGLLCTLPLRESKPPRVEGELRIGYLETLASPALRPLWFIGTTYAFGLSAYFAFLKTYVEFTGIGTIGLFFSTYSAAAILLRVVAGRLPERLGYKRVMFPALGAAAVGLVLVAYSSQAWHLAAAGVLCGIGHGYTFPILSAMVVERARANERGAAVSLFTALFDLGILIGSPSLGLAIGFGGYTFMYALAAGILGAAVLVFARWDATVDQRAHS